MSMQLLWGEPRVTPNLRINRVGLEMKMEE